MQESKFIELFTKFLKKHVAEKEDYTDKRKIKDVIDKLHQLDAGLFMAYRLYCNSLAPKIIKHLAGLSESPTSS